MTKRSAPKLGGATLDMASVTMDELSADMMAVMLEAQARHGAADPIFPSIVVGAIVLVIAYLEKGGPGIVAQIQEILADPALMERGLKAAENRSELLPPMGEDADG